MRLSCALTFPKNSEGTTLVDGLRALVPAPRMAFLSTLTQLAILGVERPARTLSLDLENILDAHVLKVRLDASLPLLQPLYRIWQSGASGLSFHAWMSLTCYEGYLTSLENKVFRPLAAFLPDSLENATAVIPNDQCLSSKNTGGAESSLNCLKGMFG